MNRARSARISRRQMLYTLSIAGAGTAFDWHVPACAAQAASAAGTPSFAALNRFPRMVQEFFVASENALHQQRLERLAALKTKADAEAYVQSVRGKIRESFGPFPEKTPLNARVTKVVERDAYKIENVLFESRPGFLVSANLYIPKGRRFPLPGVVGSCGHSANGKAIDTYQSFCQGLARLGYVVLIFDPIGQGERMQYVDADWKPIRGTGTAEHNYAGIQQVLVDERFCTWRAWDAVRALDYLVTREEVDRRHLGITGNSGGGTMTTWLCGLDDRWTMAAPSCFVTELRRNMENELGADMEQIPPRALALGLDHEDFLAALAPKPVIILAKEKDYFDARGNEAAYERLKRLYRLLGAENNVSYFIGPTYHGYSQENREAMYRWFNRCTGISDARTEPKLVLEKDETLWCTPHGQVAALRSKPIHDFTREKSKMLASTRRSLDAAALGRTVAHTLRLPERSDVPEFRILRPLPDRKYPIRHALPYMVETDRGVHALVYRLTREPLLSRPPRETRKAILYVSDQSADAELRSEPLCTRADRGRSRRGVPYLRRARHRRVDSPDHESEQPRRVQHRLFLFLARAHARLSLHRPADLRRAPGPRLARGMGLRPGPPCRARAGRRAGNVRGAALASGDARDAEAPARVLRGDRRITRLQLAVVRPAARRAGRLRPARLLPRAESQGSQTARAARRVAPRLTRLRDGRGDVDSLPLDMYPANI